MRNTVFVAVDVVIIGAMYCGIRYASERFRQKRGWQNGTIAGGVAGGLLGARGGPQVAFVSAATFAALATVVEFGFEQFRKV